MARRTGAIPRVLRRVGVLVAGGVVTLVGVLLIPLPGPGFVVIPLGLAILATEFEWAGRWLERTKQWSKVVTDKFHRA